jgi:hypothetical protein
VEFVAGLYGHNEITALQAFFVLTLPSLQQRDAGHFTVLCQCRLANWLAFA